MNKMWLKNILKIDLNTFFKQEISGFHQMSNFCCIKPYLKSLKKKRPVLFVPFLPKMIFRQNCISMHSLHSRRPARQIIQLVVLVNYPTNGMIDLLVKNMELSSALCKECHIWFYNWHSKTVKCDFLLKF